MCESNSKNPEGRPVKRCAGGASSRFLVEQKRKKIKQKKRKNNDAHASSARSHRRRRPAGGKAASLSYDNGTTLGTPVGAARVNNGRGSTALPANPGRSEIHLAFLFCFSGRFNRVSGEYPSIASASHPWRCFLVPRAVEMRCAPLSYPCPMIHALEISCGKDATLSGVRDKSPMSSFLNPTYH